MSYFPVSRFSPLELSGPGAPSGTALARSVAAAHELERLLEMSSVRQSNGFLDSVMSAIAAEPLPAPALAIGVALRSGRLSALATAVRDSWRVAWAGGRPPAVRL